MRPILRIAGEQPDKLMQLDAAYREFWAGVMSERTPYPLVHIGHLEENPIILTPHWAWLEGGPVFQFADNPPRYRTLGVHGDWITKWGKDGRATWRLNVRFGYEIQNVELWANVENVTDELYANVASKSRFGHSFTPGAARTVVFGVGYKFGRR